MPKEPDEAFDPVIEIARRILESGQRWERLREQLEEKVRLLEVENVELKRLIRLQREIREKIR